jgi:hypothetical protein
VFAAAVTLAYRFFIPNDGMMTDELASLAGVYSAPVV